MAEAETLPQYVPGPVERFGRRFKMEYVGMASVFVITATFFFGDIGRWYQSVAAMLAIYGLFMGIKKKTRDHFSASWLLFAAAALARPSLMDDPRWVWPYFFFGVLMLIMEGYLEKLQNHVYALPVVFALWGATDLSWILGMAFVALYLPNPLTDKEVWRKRFFAMAALSAVAGCVASAVRWDAVTSAWADWPADRLPLGPTPTVFLLVMEVLVLTALVTYWKRILWTHRASALVFAFLAPWDERLLAPFGLVGAILLSATFFRQSIDSVRLRPIFKHAEWHFFWYVLVFAIWNASR